ncbi:perilipin-1-like isoform X2 [Panulirus ornatus]|uniref:perilipin-1-like isoform X2 n=1 Tax=Panulirus ornatus TaxID=150431 RepID=UPI003A876B6E
MARTHGSLQARSCFVGRLLALPSVSDALALTANVYRRTKDYRCVGAVVGAAETSVRIAMTGAIPLAAPIIHSAGDWKVLDEWACRGLDSVEEMAPIVTKPTNEMVEDIQGRVLSLLAGTTTTTAADDEPLTLTSALTTRVHNTVELLSNTKRGRTAAEVAERLLEAAHFLLDYYLPPDEGDLQESNGRGGGVVTKASTLAHKTQLRLFRVTHSVIHPHHPDCDSSRPTQLVRCAARAAREWYWTPKPWLGVNHLTTVARIIYSLALHAYARLSAILQTLLPLVSSLDPRSAASVTARAMMDLCHIVAKITRKLLLRLAIFCMALEGEIMKIWAWSDYRLRCILTSWEQRERASTTMVWGLATIEEREESTTS